MLLSLGASILLTWNQQNCLSMGNGNQVLFHSKQQNSLIGLSEHWLLIYLFVFLPTLGPPLPIGLSAFSMLSIQGDAFVFGGTTGGEQSYLGTEQSSIYQFRCSSRICSWTTLNQELKVARYLTSVIPVPDSFCKGK